MPLRFKTLDVLMDYRGNHEGYTQPVHFYALYCERSRKNCKIDNLCVVLYGDMGYPDVNNTELFKNPVIICGGVFTLGYKLKNNPWPLPFNPKDYDGKDFAGTYLQVLKRDIKIESNNDYKFPYDFTEYEWEPEGFNYLKKFPNGNTIINPNDISSKPRKIGYSYRFADGRETSLTIPTKTKKTYIINPALPPKLALVPKIKDNKPIKPVKPKTPLANPSNMGIIAYE